MYEECLCREWCNSPPIWAHQEPGCPKLVQKRSFSGSKVIQTSFDDATDSPHSKTGLLTSVPM
ncbi:hypothetical protein BOTBODRAFT_31073 [Botryobasidium botryosum FD-172 SS1]|uniref:Uncharacterized protein n=1 Tax=Botryobasidium botryosum (strain FD-172 SS1) TaxID=930990 RepID=A0A067MNX6_BOTB1|nr:hypothetical protein BOTBODRAFT_31073 [Botryobasidium botryosum FD-172 SS1]